jgi:hexosaminidase
LEAPLWCEFVPNVGRLDWQTWPRLAAFAETGWTLHEGKDFDSFRARLGAFLERLDVLGVGYALPDDVEPGWFRRLFGLFTIVRAQTGVRLDG